MREEQQTLWDLYVGIGVLGLMDVGEVLTALFKLREVSRAMVRPVFRQPDRVFISLPARARMVYR